MLAPPRGRLPMDDSDVVLDVRALDAPPVSELGSTDLVRREAQVVRDQLRVLRTLVNDTP